MLRREVTVTVSQAGLRSVGFLHQLAALIKRHAQQTSVLGRVRWLLILEVSLVIFFAIILSNRLCWIALARKSVLHIVNN